MRGTFLLARGFIALASEVVSKMLFEDVLSISVRLGFI